MTKKQHKILNKILFKIQELLELTDFEMAALLHMGEVEFKKYLKSANGKLVDVKRLTTFISVINSIGSMFSNPKDQIQWIRTYHRELGKNPLNYMIQEKDNVYKLNEYLEQVRNR